MRRNILTAAALLSVVTLLGSCSENNSDKTNALINEIMSEAAAAQTAQLTAPAVSDTTKLVTTEMPAVSDETAETTVGADISDSEDTVSIDLTKMNATMVYSVIYDIMVNTDRYYGRTILLDGFFDTSLDEKYYFVVVPDATACCLQGLEFKLPDDKVYPDDYPQKRDDIRIRGTLEKYDEDGQAYCYIKADWVKVL